MNAIKFTDPKTSNPNTSRQKDLSTQVSKSAVKPTEMTPSMQSTINTQRYPTHIVDIADKAIGLKPSFSKGSLSVKQQLAEHKRQYGKPKPDMKAG